MILDPLLQIEQESAHFQKEGNSGERISAQKKLRESFSKILAIFLKNKVDF